MDFISGITSAIALGISIILLLATWGWLKQGKGEYQTHYYLMALLAIICLQLFELIYHSFNLHKQWPIFIKLVDPLVVMTPCLLFAYLAGLKGRSVEFEGVGFLHLLPACYVLAWDIPFWFLSSVDKIQYMDQGFLEAKLWTHFVPYRSDYLLLLAALIIFYWWKLKGLLTVKVGPTSRIDEFIQRVRLAMLLLAVVMLVSAMRGYGNGTNMVLSIGAGVLVGYLCYFFLLQVRLPRANPTLDREMFFDERIKEGGLVPVINESDTDKAKWECAYRALEKQLVQGGLFENNDLSLAKLSSASGMNVHMASKAINECSGGNFYDWVNLYRVEKAKVLLAETKVQVSSICYDVGFNSKSTFYAAFKKNTGLTPAVYRKDQEQ